MTNPADRRESERIDVRLSADVMYQGRNFTARTRNLSVGGVCLEVNRDLPEGAQLQINLFIVIEDIEDASSPTLALRGIVAWCIPPEDGAPAQVGVRFDRIAPVQVAALTRILKLATPAADGA